jgi:HAE1 family hydrophobic/amphiphilic exporter-1
MALTSTGLVPNEDTGTLFVMISAAPGTGQERTQEITEQVDKMLANNPAIQYRQQIVGYNFMAGQGSDQATFVIKLKPFEERSNGFIDKIINTFKGDPLRWFVNPKEANMVLGMIYKQTANIKDAQILAFGPPMIPGFSLSNAVTMTL